MFERWSFDRWAYPVHSHESVHDFRISGRLAAGIHEIADGHHRIHLLFENRRSRYLLVFFHGSMRPEQLGDFTLPVFAGTHLTEDLRADHLLLSDSTLGAGSSEVQLGWYSGTSDYDFSKRVDQIICHVVGQKPYQKIVFIGGSGGGYAALRASALYRDSIAIVWNPQTEIGCYRPSVVSDYAQMCFGVEKYDQIDPYLRQDRFFNIKPLYAGERNINNIVYFQNAPDTFHVERHAAPFMASLTGKQDWNMPEAGVWRVAKTALLVSGGWEGEHTPPPRKYIRHAIETMLKSPTPTEGLELLRNRLLSQQARSQLFKTHVSLP